MQFGLGMHLLAISVNHFRGDGGNGAAVFARSLASFFASPPLSFPTRSGYLSSSLGSASLSCHTKTLFTPRPRRAVVVPSFPPPSLPPCLPACLPASRCLSSLPDQTFIIIMAEYSPTRLYVGNLPKDSKIQPTRSFPFFPLFFPLLFVFALPGRCASFLSCLAQLGLG